MTDNIKLPPMPETEWNLHMPARLYEAAWTSTASGYTEADMENYAREAVRLNAKADIRALIADDAYAMTFQSLGQYRSALLAALSAAPAAPQPGQQPLTDEKDALLRQALEALEGFANITNDSRGVAGYHLNGDIAKWGEFPEVYHADKALEAIRNHLGVKND